MTNTKAAIPETKREDLLSEQIIDAIQDIKGKNIIKLDLRDLDEAPTDFFIICEGDSHTQVKAISDNINKQIKDLRNISPFRTEGELHASWILVDYFDVIIHIFYRETRAFYELEDLWSDAKVTEYQNL